MKKIQPKSKMPRDLSSKTRGSDWVRPAKENPWRPSQIACGVFVFLGYIFYFLALLVPTPKWGRMLMEYMTPSIQGLHTVTAVAAKTGGDPFPAQVVILYCAISLLVLMVWFILHYTLNVSVKKAFLQSILMMNPDKRPTRLRLFVSGLFLVLAFLFGIYMAFWSDMGSVTWRTQSYFSSSIYSTTFLIFGGASFAVCISFGCLLIRIAIFNKD